MNIEQIFNCQPTVLSLDVVDFVSRIFCSQLIFRVFCDDDEQETIHSHLFMRLPPKHLLDVFYFRSALLSVFAASLFVCCSLRWIEKKPGHKMSHHQRVFVDLIEAFCLHCSAFTRFTSTFSKSSLAHYSPFNVSKDVLMKTLSRS